MMRHKKLIALVLLCLCALCSCSPAYAGNYILTEAELTQLEQEFSRQQTLLEKAESDNKQSQIMLLTLKEKLKNSQAQSISLTRKLEELRIQSAAQETALLTAEQALNAANQSLQEYEREQKKTQSRLRTQRNIAYIILGGSIVMLAAKR